MQIFQPRGFAGVGKIGEKGDRGPKGFRGRDCDQTAMDGSTTKIIPHDGEKGEKGDKVGSCIKCCMKLFIKLT